MLGLLLVREVVVVSLEVRATNAMAFRSVPQILGLHLEILVGPLLQMGGECFVEGDQLRQPFDAGVQVVVVGSLFKARHQNLILNVADDAGHASLSLVGGLFLSLN